ncbi:MAG: hypothetical protein ACXQTS_01055 [Candidatus Methanospirareceae archaeon]
MVREAKRRGKNVTKITELISLATSVHIDVLDEVYEKVPEQAKGAILKAKEASMNGKKSALKALSEDNPKRAVDMSLDMIKGRLERGYRQ